MDVVFDYVFRLWPVALGIIGLIAWAVKAENRITQNAQALQRVEKENTDQITRLETRIDIRRKEDMDRLEKTLAVMMTDIKTLLQRGH